MDPVSLIVAALTAGAVAGAQNTATDVIKDGYTGLKALVRRRFAGRASAETALERHESAPEAWAGALKAELAEAGAGQDSKLVEAAQRLMTLLKAAGTQEGSYVIDARGAQGMQTGSHNTQTNTFTSRPPPG